MQLGSYSRLHPPRGGRSLSAFLLTAWLGTWLSAAGQELLVERVDQSRGGQTGTTFHVRLEGTGLSRVDDVLFYDQGLELAALESPDDGRLELQIRAQPNCRLGEHAFSVVTPFHCSRVRTLRVSPYPVVEEAEPNSRRQSAQKLETPCTVTGIVEETDEDWYEISCQAGERLSVEVVAMPLERYLFDAMIEVFGPDGKQIAASDDSPLLKQDPLICLSAPTTGVYSIRIREAAFGGDLDSRYRLHVGNFQRPTVAYPAGARIGQPETVTLLGDAMGAIEEQLLLTSPSSRTVRFNPDPSSPGYVLVRASDYPNVLEQEPNSSRATGTPSKQGIRCALNGILEEPGDEDYFTLELDQGEAFAIETYAARLGSPIDTTLPLFDTEGRELTANDDGHVHDSQLRFVAPHTGRYYLRVKDHLGRGGPTCVYRIEFEPIQPKLDLLIPTPSNGLPQQMQAVIVPRGGQIPLFVSCRRQNFAGPVELHADGLPKGVRLESQPVEPGSHLAVVNITAELDAPVGASLFTLHGKASVDGGQVYGPLTQKVGLVFGQPRNTVYHSIDLQRIPILVTDEAPFALEVTPPSAPLVQDGRLDLNVSVLRQAGFDAGVELSLAIAPDWIQGPEVPLRVSQNETEATFTVFASDEAALRSHTVILVGKAMTDIGEWQLASKPFELKVQSPWVQLNIDKVVSHPNAQVVVPCKMQWHGDRGSVATARLRGLPKGASAMQQSIRVGQSQLEFPVTLSSSTPPAIHNTLFVELTIDTASEPVTHFLGHGGVLEVLERGATPQPELSRLEQLRQQTEGRGE